VVPAVHGRFFNQGPRVVEIYHHPEPVERLGTSRDLEVLGVAVKVGACPAVRQDPVRSIEGERRGEAHRNHSYAVLGYSHRRPCTMSGPALDARRSH